MSEELRDARDRAREAEAKAIALARELAAAFVLLEPIYLMAEDAASPGYRLDAHERLELRNHLSLFAGWRAEHAALIEWARAHHGGPKR